MQVTKAIAFEESEIKFDKTGARPVFKGYASVFDVVDADGDIIRPGAFAQVLTSQQRQVGMFFNHQKMDVPIGKWLRLAEDSKGLYAEGELTPGVRRSADIHAAMEHGTIAGLSVNFGAEKSDVELSRTGRIFKSTKYLREISICTQPANPDAFIDSMKSIEGLETVRDVEDWLRDAAGLSRQGAQSLIVRFKSAIRRESEGDGIAALLQQINSFPQIVKGN